MYWLTENAQTGNDAANASCGQLISGITSSFVPASFLAQVPQWKNRQVKGHVGWFALGIKAGCRT